MRVVAAMGIAAEIWLSRMLNARSSQCLHSTAACGERRQRGAESNVFRSHGRSQRPRQRLIKFHGEIWRVRRHLIFDLLDFIFWF